MAFNPAMSRRLVLSNQVDASSVRAVAEESGWSYVGNIKADPESGTCYEVKWETENGTAVHYIVDDFVGMAYLVAMNENRESAEDVIDQAAMIRAGTRHRDAEVRMAASWAMAYAEWPDFLETLDVLARTDEDPAVCQAAASALAEFRAAGGEQRRPE